MTATSHVILGRLATVGSITTCENYPQEFSDDLNFKTTRGVIIEMSDDNIRAAASMFGKTIEVRAATLVDPSAPHTTVNAAAFICEGFPRPLTQADIDALYKRALAAEDHLRREVASGQALAAEVKRLSGNGLVKTIDELHSMIRLQNEEQSRMLEHLNHRDTTIANLRATSAKLAHEAGVKLTGEPRLVLTTTETA